MDDDDKVRRNLMVLSFAVLVYFWLNLPDGIVVARILGSAAPTAIAAWKVWVLLLAVLAYQLHRFGSVTVTSKEWQEARERYRIEKVRCMRAFSQWNAGRHLRGARLLWADAERPRHLGPPIKPTRELESESARVSDIAFPSDTDGWFTVVIFADKNSEPMDDASRLWVVVPRQFQLAFSIWVLCRMARSRHLSHIGIPVLMGVTAAVFCAARLVSLLIQ